MSLFVLYHKKSMPTGSVLGTVLGAEHGEYIPGQATRDAVIRWGSRASGFWGTSTTLNSASAISLASDKFRSLQVMKEAGVNVPEFSRDPGDLAYPFLGRRTSHSKGRDVVLCLQRGDYLRNPRDYYVQYVPTTREFRVHVFDGEVIRVQGKFISNPKQSRNFPWIRNHTAGYTFKKPRKTLRSERLNMAVQAVQALGLDFGAVDLLIGDDGDTYILEVNTAPACSPLTMRAYVEAFSKKLGLERRNIRFSLLDKLSETEEDEDGEDDEENDGVAVEQAVQEREPAPAETQSVTAERPEIHMGFDTTIFWKCVCDAVNRNYTHTCTRCGRRQGA